MRISFIALLWLSACTTSSDYGGPRRNDFERGTEERIEAACAGHISCSEQPFDACERQLDDRLGDAKEACTSCLRDLDCERWNQIGSPGRLCDLCNSCFCTITASQRCSPGARSIPGSPVDPCQAEPSCPESASARVDTCTEHGFWSGTCVCTPRADAGPRGEFDAGL